jgi:putative transposase
MCGRGVGNPNRVRLLHRRDRLAQELYILVFIELGSRLIHLSPSTAHPDSAWVTQQARNLVLDLDARASSVRFLIRDRDTKFSGLV